jgi:hypothetical protein
MKKPSFFQTLSAYIPKKDEKMPRSIKALVAIFGPLQAATTLTGAYIGATAATTTAGAIGLGTLGFIAGNVAGGLIGGVAFLALIIYKGRKAEKSSAKNAPSKSGPAITTLGNNFIKLQLKNRFENASKDIKAKAVLTIKKHTPHFGR